MDSIGVVAGSDMTPECALTKLSYLLGKGLDPEVCREQMRLNLRGELTVLSKQPRFTYSHRTQGLLQSLLKLLGAESTIPLVSNILDMQELGTVEDYKNFRNFNFAPLI